MPDKTCPICGQPRYRAKSGELYKYCEAHQKQMWREKQTPVKKYIVCADCGAEIEKRGNTVRCPECALKARRTAQAARQRAAREKQYAQRAAVPKPERVAVPKPERVAVPKPERVAVPKKAKGKGVDFLLEDHRGDVYHVRAFMLRRVKTARKGAALFKLRGIVAIAQEPKEELDNWKQELKEIAQRARGGR